MLNEGSCCLLFGGPDSTTRYGAPWFGQNRHHKVSVSISPSSANVQGGLSQQFTATVSGTNNSGVSRWCRGRELVYRYYFVNKLVLISNSTEYLFANNASTGNRSVTIWPGSASVQVGVSQQFTATVSGTTNTAVNWLVAGVSSGNSSVGTISSSGLYTGQSSVPNGPRKVTAQSASASTQSASATVTVTSARHSVALSWNADGYAVAGYNVYRGTLSGGPYST
jgi:hypothetical protein